MQGLKSTNGRDAYIDMFRILKPGVGWAQVSEYTGRTYENDIPPVDSYN